MTPTSPSERAETLTAAERALWGFFDERKTADGRVTTVLGKDQKRLDDLIDARDRAKEALLGSVLRPGGR